MSATKKKMVALHRLLTEGLITEFMAAVVSVEASKP